MKRSIAALQRDLVEKQDDDLLRAQLLRDEAAQKANQKNEKKIKQYSAKWKGHLAKWDEMGLISLGARGLLPPRPEPLCMHSPRYVRYYY